VAPSRVAAVLGGREAYTAAGGRTPDIRAGETLFVRVDRILLDGPGASALLAATAAARRGVPPSRAAPDGVPGVTLADTSRLVFVPGLEQPRTERRVVLAFAREQRLPLGFLPARAGWPAVVAADEGLIGSRDVVVGTRPDVGALGGLGCVALRAGQAELETLLTDPALGVVVPPTRFARVTGRLPRWVSGFDLALALLAQAGGPDALRGRVLELHGDTLEALDIPDRLTLCATLASCGVASIVPPDARTAAWLAARRVSPERSPEPASSVPPAGADWLELDARTVALTVIAEPWPGKRLPFGRGAPVPVEEVIIGGRLEELRAAAEVLRERNIHPGLDLQILPASQRVLLHAIEEGLAADFLRAGARLAAPGSLPVPSARGDRRLVCGPATPNDLVAGPAVAAASAAAGTLIDPETMRRENRRSARRS
jgi:3-isopropylmalate/(R)-2-methylmalate dehydratase large subunit